MKKTRQYAEPPPSEPNPQPRPGRRERAKLEKRTKIVEAARHLFREKGFDATTTLEIAERADIGSGTLFLYARTKEDLVVMVFHDELMAVTKSAFDSVPKNRDLVDQLLHVFLRMVDYHQEDLSLTATILRLVLIPASLERTQDVNEMLTLTISGISSLVDAKKQSGDIDVELDTYICAKSIFSIYWGALIYWVAGYDERKKLESELGLSLQLFYRGIARNG